MEPEVNGNGHAAANGRVNGSEVGVRLRGYLRSSQATVLHHLQLPGDRARSTTSSSAPPESPSSTAGITAAARPSSRRVSFASAAGTAPALIEEVLDQAAAVRDLLSDSRYSDVRVDAAIAVSKAGAFPTVKPPTAAA